MTDPATAAGRETGRPGSGDDGLVQHRKHHDQREPGYSQPDPVGRGCGLGGSGAGRRRQIVPDREVVTGAGTFGTVGARPDAMSSR